MMKIQNSDFYEILPDSFKNTETRCVAYALSKAVQRLCAAARDVSVMAGIGELSENILDYLAVELRAPYYKPDMSQEKKADIIAATLPWFLGAGTKAALENLLQKAFGGGRVTEWFDYDGDPFHFKVAINSSGNDFDNNNFMSDLAEIVNRAKNARSVPDEISLYSEINTDADSAPFIGAAFHSNIIQNGADSTIPAGGSE